jgi:HSP20 family protein
VKRRISSGWELELLQRHFDELFDLVCTPAVPAPAGWAPAVDLVEFPDRFVVRLDLPGVEREDVTIALLARSLRISGQKRQQREGCDDRRYHRMERGFGPFDVEVGLAEGVIASGATATLTTGVLEVTLPRQASIPEHVHFIELKIEEP